MEDLEMYVLGIDGGGTKTKGVIADQRGKIIAQHTVGASNPNSMQQADVEKELIELFTALRKQAGAAVYSELSVVFAGMSGVDRDDDRILMKKMLQKCLTDISPNDCKIIVDNDGINALYSGTLGCPGIVNIAGTGSITYGMNHDGQRARVGGWGYLIGDPGSGYAIGRAALQAVFDAYDGCGEKTSLTGLILDHFSINLPPDLIEKIYEPGKARKAVAPLSQLVVKAADEGDEVAQQILVSAGEDMAKAISCLLKKLFSKTSEYDKQESTLVVLTGGVYRRSDWFEPSIQDLLLKKEFKIEIIFPQVPPVAGALVAALNSVKIDVKGSFIDQLQAEGLTNE
jgi:N-acetylglucosamine kinase-like BadF-type ATPase